MFNYIYQPISFNNPIVLPTAYNYLSGYAMGIDLSWYGGGNIFTGTLNTGAFFPKTYTFGQKNNASSNIFTQNDLPSTGSAGYRYYEFGQGKKQNANIVKTDTTSKPNKKVALLSHTVSKIIPAKKDIDLRSNFVSTANKYIGQNETNGDHKKFCINKDCNAFNQGEWCTDFVTYVVKESYRNEGLKAPAWFGNHDVETLKKDAASQGKFKSVLGIADKGKYISNNIKPGDIFILNENGDSHTGFVTSVDKSGGFYTTEGNRDDKVTSFYYSPNYKGLSGFIQLT